MNFSTSLLFIFIFSLQIISFSHAQSSASICNDTPYPSFCKSFLQPNRSATIHDYARFSIQKSLWKTQTLLYLVNGYLRYRRALPQPTVRALDDCQFLANLNMDFLSDTLQTIGSQDSLETLKADDMQTLLSATLTNHQTCVEGLQATASASRVTNNLQGTISNGSMLYSVSLAIFKNGWVRDEEEGRKLSSKKFVSFSKDKEYRYSNVDNDDLQQSSSIKGRKLIESSDLNIKVLDMVVVNPDGSGNFTTIQEAVDASPNKTRSGKGYFVIYVVAGVYEEYITIPKNKPYLMMIGDGINQTIITGNRSVVDGWTTFKSATLAAVGPGFIAANITFRNTAGAAKHQAVAVRNGADLSTFYRCSFEGYQDTLYAHSLRQFYKECDIYGTVDFIFGNAAALFQNCNIYPRLPMVGQFNAITAQGRTDINQNTGISIQNCNITAASELASSDGKTKTFLGRPWKQYSRTVYMQSSMDNVIDPAGWIAWSGDFALDTLYYGEYDNSGAGSVSDKRVTWSGIHKMNETEADTFTVSNFILGDMWLPTTGVPYDLSL